MVNVIVLEPDPMVQSILRKVAEGQKTANFAGCAAALKDLETLLDANPRRPVLIIGEIRLSDGSLPGWISEARKTDESLDFLPVTGDTIAASWFECRAAGAVEYIIKPFDPLRVEQALVRYLQFRRKILPDVSLTQEMLDGWMRISEKREVFVGNQVTCDKIIRYAAACQRVYFTVQDAVHETGLSASTLRRYLNMLEMEGKIESFSDYGKRGRPLILYRLKKGDCQSDEGHSVRNNQ